MNVPSVPAPGRDGRDPDRPPAQHDRWSVLAYALGSWGAALRLCLILAFVALLAWLLHAHLLL
jgi:hypothetical protein